MENNHFSLTYWAYAKLQTEIVVDGPREVGYSTAIFHKLSLADALDAVHDMLDDNPYLTSEWSREDYLIHHIIDQMTLTEFKEVAPYFFNYGRLITQLKSQEEVTQ